MTSMNIYLLKYASTVSYVLWRYVCLRKEMSTRNRVLVTFVWVKGFMLGRDIMRQ